ncbi:MAG: hypothetical protein ACRDHZ_13465 [Ktedonobacteraceae bacterium]
MSHAYAKKERLTVSLSHETREYLETERERAHSPSLSAYFENLIQALRAKAEMSVMEARATAYYDNLSETEMEEQADWGRVGAASISRLEG